MTDLNTIPLWHRFELTLTSTIVYDNPPQQATLMAQLTSPSGVKKQVYGFWDGGATWRVRSAPDEVGDWTYSITCSDHANSGLHDQQGGFVCAAPTGDTIFQQHGDIRLSANQRYFVHADGTPFLWMADTAWAAPTRSTDEEWTLYLHERKRQKFNAVQWMTTQTLCIESDINGRRAFEGTDRITLDPAFFQRLDGKLEQMNESGMLGLPVLLWAAMWADAAINAMSPGFALPEDQAILLARYMVARWGAHQVVWMLPGDGDYLGAGAPRWKRIGQAVFGAVDHAPVCLHPRGMIWTGEEFDDQEWFDYIGYQSGHGDDDATITWLVEGPPATLWSHGKARPVINLEPPYEDHIAYQSGQRFSALATRKRLYWSLLIAPTAGVTYGGHGIWGWDDGTQPPMNHPNTGIPKRWQDALLLPVAEQIAHLMTFFAVIEWWRLRPAPSILLEQPGAVDKEHFVAASASVEGDLAVIYIPEGDRIRLQRGALKANLRGTWFNPATGVRTATAENVSDQFDPPTAGDWLLLLS